MQLPRGRNQALIMYSLTAWIYGSGLIVGYTPTFARVTNGHFAVGDLGWVFIAAGLLCITTLWRPKDRWQFAVGMFVSIAWFGILATYWEGPVGWNGGISWLGIAALLLAASGWLDYRGRS